MQFNWSGRSTESCDEKSNNKWTVNWNVNWDVNWDENGNESFASLSLALELEKGADSSDRIVDHSKAGVS